jgi:peptidoglycan/xylan/chitin deacetylase (PgdA/CDA1 family)
MEELHRGGFQVISLSRLVISINIGASLPDRPVVIAFDDGFESVYTHALPVLQ